LLFHFVLEYTIAGGVVVQVNQEGLKLNGTHQFLAYADDNIVGENIDAHKISIRC
jgi:hypothetical protein